MKIGTHDGVFHCDEALACFLLKLLPRYKDAEIVRSRDMSILDTCDIVVDVGRKYDPSIHRYDHHMRDFKESLSTVMKKPGYDSTIKLSSAGLIYCHFGHEILRQLVPKEMSDEDVWCVFKKVYDSLIKEIDGIDNGIPMYDGEPLYRIVTHLSARVDRLNREMGQEDFNQDEQFMKAVALVGEEFMYFVNYTSTVWMPARSIVRASLEKRFEVDPSGEIAELDQDLPWIEHLFMLEKDLDIKPTLKYMVLWNSKKASGSRIRAVPIEPSSFLLRIPFPKEWAGLSGESLEKVCGIEGAVFVHAAQFIGGHENKEGALAMARKALELGKSA